MIKNDCSTENEKLKPFTEELKINIEILSKFTSGLKKKYKTQKMMQVQHVMTI